MKQESSLLRNLRNTLCVIGGGILILHASIVPAQAPAPVIQSGAASALGSGGGNDKSASECLITVIGKDTGCPRCKDVKDDPRFPANSDKSKCPQIKYQSNVSGISKEVVARLKDCVSKGKPLPFIVGEDGKVSCGDANPKDMMQKSVDGCKCPPTDTPIPNPPPDKPGGGPPPVCDPKTGKCSGGGIFDDPTGGPGYGFGPGGSTGYK
jgi:hypothetical protein